MINNNILDDFYYRLKRRYGEVWVDLPYYLTEKSNYFQDDAKELYYDYEQEPESFFEDNKQYIDVPVISAPLSYSFDLEKNIYDSIKSEFNKIAVRIRVPLVEITTNMLSSLSNLVEEMRDDDVLLLDVFQFTSIETQIFSNIEKMNEIFQQNDVNVSILNAFETNQLNCHNYGPLLSAYFNMEGFGDFATEERYKASGGGGSPTRKIRYYEPSTYTLWFFKDANGYNGAKEKLVQSGSWENTSLTPQHLTICNVCYEVNNDDYNKDNGYWKRFKILHYLNCIANETRSQYSSFNTSEDLDPDGYDTILRTGGEILEW